MGANGFKRKITAIMSSDVVGYSKLMGDDEAATVKTLETYKSVMSALIDQHRGRVIDSPGDNMLSEFASVVDAVQCAVAIQKELNSRNAVSGYKSPRSFMRRLAWEFEKSIVRIEQ
jgi:adenylate cyclase